MEIWINPDCSKCRTAVSMLDDSGADYTVRRYLDDPPSVAELTDVLARLQLEPWDVTRTGEPVAAELGLDAWPRNTAHRDRWLTALAEHPQLLQRPILTADDGATVIGRSTTAVQSVLPRPRRSRATVRVLMLAPDGRVLLLHDSDPGNGARWWLLPGGGIDPGESHLDAVVREIAEETGLAIDPATVVGPLAQREVLHGYSDKIVDQHDTYYAVRVAPFELSTAGHTEDEQLTVIGHRWFAPAELATSEDPVWPALLPDLLDLLERPADWPVDLPPVEESSVPVPRPAG